MQRRPGAGETRRDDSPQRRELGVGFPQVVHDRCRTAAEELHKLLISLATGALGVYFIVLKSSVVPALTPAQRWVAIGGLFGLSIALACGIAAWFADARRNFYWASAMQAVGKEEKRQLYKLRDKWLSIKDSTVATLGISFALGIALSVAYIAFRICSI